MSDNLTRQARGAARPSIVRKIFIAVMLGFVVGGSCMALRLYLGGDDSPVWRVLNALLFIDVTADEGISGIGVFFIMGQLFMRALQLAIVPLVLTSLSLALCSLSDPRKLSRLAVKTFVAFLGFYLVTALLAACIAYVVKLAGGFSVTLPGTEATELRTVDAYNPLATVVGVVAHSSWFTAPGRQADPRDPAVY